ncbi:MAG: hypothetical protein RJA07_467 [Bacteroidota bacterium]|jgi:hypothetical protein
MEATKKRKVQNGEQYNHLFPKAKFNEITIKRNASLIDTIVFIPKVVHETQWQTKKIAALLQGKNVHETCSNIWHFVYQHIAYNKDEDGYEQIRSPARAWHDRFKGVDCDCYSVFISTILNNLHIKHSLRITKYKTDSFQHIYPIVPMPNGSHITIDCVVNQFNYEEPYSEKKDYQMNLQYLNGVNDDDQFFAETQHTSTDDALFGNWNDDDLSGDLGKFRLHLKEKLKKGLHFINRINPGAVLLRNGVLASLKLNLFKVAQRMKWAYLTPEQAQQKGIILDKYYQLVKVKDKLEKIFYGAGGKPDNFRHAMLKGKGNKHRDIAVFGLGNMDDATMLQLTPSTTVEELLGVEMYQSENVEGLEDLQGFGALGEPVTAAAAIAAASGIMASIAVVIKGIGNIFHPSATDTGTKDFNENELEKHEDVNAADVDAATQDAIKVNAANINNDDNNNAAAKNNTTIPTDDGGNNQRLMMTNITDDKKKEAKPEDEQGFWDKNKKWIKPVASIAGGVALFTIAILALKPKPMPSTKPINQPALSGTTTSRKRNKKQHQQKKAVALM